MLNTRKLTILLIIGFAIFDIISAVTKQNRRRLRRPNVPTSLNRDQNAASSNAFKIQVKPNRRISDDNQYKVVCYYTNWSQYRTKIGRFTPEDISPDLCTHIIFAFAWMKKGKITSFESNDETKDGTIGLYERIMKLKLANPKLKILLAIGGWSFGTQKFKDMTSTRFGRQTFIYSAIPFVRDRNFDGLDLDWEYPKGSDDKKNFVLLVKELVEAFEAEAQETKKPRLLLTAAVPVGPDNIRGGYDVPTVSKYLDFINVMAYDFHGKWERETGHNAPLYAPSSDSEWRKQLSVTHAANLWHKLGAPKEKLIIGMPTYGRSFALSNLDKNKVNSPSSGGGKAGEYTKESGFLAYYEICEMLYNGANYVYDDEMQVPYAYRDDQWVGFDDEKAIRNKMKWLKSSGFGGAMVWALDMDDFNGTACRSVRYPLISVISEELLGRSRGNNVKDFDWNKIAGSVNEVIERSSDPESMSSSLDGMLTKSKIKKHVIKPNSIQQQSSDTFDERPAQVLCYVTSWSRKRSGIGRFLPEDIDGQLCTHIIYAFATIKNNQLAEAEDTDLDAFEKLASLKEKNSNLKTLLAIGGWTFGSKPFQELTSNVFRMNKFIYDAIEFLRKHKFDGLEIDWEYPRSADDKVKYLNLLKELRVAFEGEAKISMQPILLLSVSIPASLDTIQAGYDLPEMSKYLDFINIMTYDFHGQWEKEIGHNSPLYALEGASNNQKKLTIDYVANEIVREGAPKEKIMIGLAAYGRTFTLSDVSQFDIGSSATGGGKPGRFTKESGFLSFYEICDFLKDENTTLVWDNEQQVPFAYHGDQWVGFDDERSLKIKVKWLKDNGFGGVMVWTLDMDDSKNYCGAEKYPLMKKINEELQGYRVKLEYKGPFDTSGGFLSKKSLPTKQNVEELVCDEENGHISYHADKNDCKMYFMCEGERKHHMPCPSNLVFNPNENVCDWPENVENCLHLTAAPPTSR